MQQANEGRVVPALCLGKSLDRERNKLPPMTQLGSVGGYRMARVDSKEGRQ